MGRVGGMSGKVCLIILSMVLINLMNVSGLSIVVQVPEKYVDVVAGERFYFEIEIKYPENPKRKNLRLEYEILTVDEDLVSQSKALKAVETQASFIDFIVIPRNTKPGLHKVNVKVTDYESLNEEVSSSFNVRGAEKDEIMVYFLIILVAIILVGVLVVFSIVQRRKK